MLLLLMFTLWSIAAIPPTSAVHFEEVFYWSSLDWEYPNETARQEATRRGEIIPENAIPVGVAKWGRRIFVSVPRWRKGIPATLNTVSFKEGSEPPTPLLKPYPDWSWHVNENNCVWRCFSVVRLAVDKYGRLWIADNGGLLNQHTICPPKLIVFSLNNDQIVKIQEFPSSVIGKDSQIINVVVDWSSKSQRTFVYFVDLGARTLIVYDEYMNKFWVVSHPYFHPDPIASKFVVSDTQFWELYGLFGITLGPDTDNDLEFLYFTPGASSRLFAVRKTILRDEYLSQSSLDRFVYTRGQRQSQAPFMVMDDNGVLFFPLTSNSSMNCWSRNTIYTPENFHEIERNDVTLQFVADVRIFGSDVWVLSNRYTRFRTGVIDWRDINFRVLKIPIHEAVWGTMCESLWERGRK